MAKAKMAYQSWRHRNINNGVMAKMIMAYQQPMAASMKIMAKMKAAACHGVMAAKWHLAVAPVAKIRKRQSAAAAIMKAAKYRKIMANRRKYQ